MRKVVLTTGFHRSYFWTPENDETLLEKSSPTFVDAIKGAIERGDADIKAPPAAAFGVEEKDRNDILNWWVNAAAISVFLRGRKLVRISLCRWYRVLTEPCRPEFTGLVI